MIMRFIQVFLLSLSLIAACSCREVSEHRIPKPDILLTFDEMVKISAEAYMIETALRMLEEPDLETPYYSVMFYDALFERSQISSEVYFQNLRYYSSDFEKSQKLYNAIQEYLNSIQEKQIAEAN